MSLGSHPGAPSGRRPAWLGLSPWLAWLLPLVAIVYLVHFAAAPSLFGIPYPVVILGPVGTFLAGAIGLGALPAQRRLRASTVLIWLLIAIASGAALLAAAKIVHVAHFALGFSGLLTAGLLFGGALVIGLRRAGTGSARPTALAVLVAIAVVTMLATDIRLIGTLFNRDLLLYLRAGSALLNHQPVYTDVVLTQAPTDPTLLPFVYPPVDLPVVAILAALPRILVEAAWPILATSAVVASLRQFGVRWAWIPVLLIWPPLIQGIWTGNANSFLLLLFALGPLAPWVLALPPLVKLQLGINSLWLVRERRWASVARGLVAIGVLVLVTLPIVGVSAWLDWVHALSAFAQTASNIRPIQGLALARYVGPALAAVLGVAVIGIALARRGRDGLATLGLASIAISPTLYLHGLSPAIPALLRLRGAALWFVLALTASFTRGRDWWLLLAILVVAPLVPILVDGSAADRAVHPIGPAGILGDWGRGAGTQEPPEPRGPEGSAVR